MIFINHAMFKEHIKKIDFLKVLVVVLALLAGLYYYGPALTNKYIIADDARICLYWVPMFQDGELFQNDLLTEYAKMHSPWGYSLLFYLVSFLFDPIISGSVVAILLIAMMSFYMFKLVEHIAGRYAGFLAAVCTMTTPLYIGRMAGGFPRAFGYVFVVMFLYYLVKKEYLKSSVAMILQALFYPMVFTVSFCTYLMTFIPSLKDIKNFKVSRSQLICLLVTVFVCGGMLFCKYEFFVDSSMGRAFDKSEMINQPEFYRGIGRWGVSLPIAPVLRETEKNFMAGSIISEKLALYANRIPLAGDVAKSRVILGVFLLFLIFEILRKRIAFPREILLLLLASMLMYKVADLFLFKLYLPVKYVKNSVPLIAPVVFSVVIAHVLSKIKAKQWRVVGQVAVVLLVLLNAKIDKSAYLIDESQNKALYHYLATLPKDALIAAHPLLADSIPTFSLRKVFINYETSNPIYNKYWETIKRRTFEFFNAYYSENPADIYRFCEKNGIDYLVVDRRHFLKVYLARKGFYFQPFNRFVSSITQQRNNFVLPRVPVALRGFEEGSIFVIHKDVLKKM